MAPNVLNLFERIAHVLDMSDPDHPHFADSAADCLDALLEIGPEISSILANTICGAPA